MSVPAPAALTPGLPSLSIADTVAVITLNRPDQHNRMEPDDIARMNAILDRIGADAGIRAVILTARGRSFCSGYDIGSFSATPGGAVNDESGHDFNHMCDKVERLRQPVVCALNGSVYGGAIDLTLACDFRLGHEGMVISVPAARLGLHYYATGLSRYVSRLGLSTTKRLMLASATIEAAELLRIGYLDEMVARDALLEQAQALAARLARNAPLAVQGMKRSLNDIAAGTADMEAINALFSASRRSRDFAEGRAAWAEKRMPDFRGE